MRNLTMMTDLYQLTMMNGYFLKGKAKEISVFDVFFRQKDTMNYAVFGGRYRISALARHVPSRFFGVS